MLYIFLIWTCILDCLFWTEHLSSNRCSGILTTKSCKFIKSSAFRIFFSCLSYLFAMDFYYLYLCRHLSFCCLIFLSFYFAYFMVFVVTDANQMSAMFAAGRAIPKIEPTDSAGPRSSWMVQPPPPRLNQAAPQQAAPQQQPQQSQSQPAPHTLCKRFMLIIQFICCLSFHLQCQFTSQRIYYCSRTSWHARHGCHELWSRACYGATTPAHASTERTRKWRAS